MWILPSKCLQSSCGYYKRRTTNTRKHLSGIREVVLIIDIDEVQRMTENLEAVGKSCKWEKECLYRHISCSNFIALGKQWRVFWLKDLFYKHHWSDVVQFLMAQALTLNRSGFKSWFYHYPHWVNVDKLI